MKYIINQNKYKLDVNDIFVIGKRANNKKRTFLFISKLLGKHLIVEPDVVKSTGYLLSSLKYGFDNEKYLNCIKHKTIPDYKEKANDNVLVLGFCETATGLGMAVASSIKNCTYQTTTREKIKDYKEILKFEEAHSHQTTHKMFNKNININDYREIILVDDEITTGNSMLNLIEELIKISNIKVFNIMSILDWRGVTELNKFKEFEFKNKVNINVYSLISGSIELDETDVIENIDETKIITEKNETITDLNLLDSMLLNTEYGEFEYFKNSGRFGVSYRNIEYTEKQCYKIASLINTKNKEKNILILGHGENIYIPSRIASYLKSFNKNVGFKTTTLSPIYCDGSIIKDKVSFLDKDNLYYFYNLNEFKNYDKVILLTETPLNIKLGSNFEIIKI